MGGAPSFSQNNMTWSIERSKDEKKKKMKEFRTLHHHHESEWPGSAAPSLTPFTSTDDLQEPPPNAGR